MHRAQAGRLWACGILAGGINKDQATPWRVLGNLHSSGGCLQSCFLAIYSGDRTRNGAELLTPSSLFYSESSVRGGEQTATASTQPPSPGLYSFQPRAPHWEPMQMW